MQRRERLPDGSFGELKKIGSTPSTSEQVAALGVQLATEKLANIKKDAIINGLGAQVAQLKLEVITLKGGAS